MGNRKTVQGQGMVTLFFFAWFCLVPSVMRAGDEDPLETARKLIQSGSYEEAARILGIYIEKIRAIAKQKNQVAEAFYLLAKMYYEVGDDQKCDDSLRAALKNNPELGLEEPNAGFNVRLARIRAEIAPQVVEKLKKLELRKSRPRKKFPWLLAVGAAAAVVVVLLLLTKKKNYTLTVSVGAGITGTPASGSYTYRKGTSVYYQFTLAADYKDLVVKINDTAAAASGSLVIGSDMRLEATATPMALAAVLDVSARDHCLELAGSAAAMQQITAGTYTLQVTGNAYFVGTAAFIYVFARYFGADNRFHLAALNIPMSLNLQLGGSPPNSPFHAFLVDGGNLADNSGELTLTLGSYQLKVHGQNNCILIESIPTAKVNLPAGSYQVRVSGSAYYVGAMPMNEVLVYFDNSSGGTVALALTVGQIVSMSSNGSTFHAFFADWSGLADNSGQLRLEFLK